MEDLKPTAPTPTPRIGITRSLNLVTPQMLVLLGVIFGATTLTLMMFQLTEKLQMAVLLAIPASVVGLYILLNPFAGTFLYVLYEFLRPYDFILALRPLRLALVIEVVTLLSWILLLIRTKKPIKWDTLNWMYLAFLGVLAFGTYNAMNNFIAYNIFQLMLVGFVMFIIATNAVDTAPRLEKMIWVLVAIHSFYAGKAIFNYVLNPTQTGRNLTSGAVGGSFLGDENDFAMAMNTFIPIIFFMFMHYKQRWVKTLCLGLLVVFVTAVITSFSRGGWVGMMAAVAFCIWFSGRRLVGFFWAGLAAIVFVATAPPQYLGEIQTISDTRESTADARIRAWKAGFKMFLDFPVFGVGPSNGGMHMADYIEGVRNANTQWGRTFHGQWAQLFAETGGIGAFLYLGMLFYVITFMNRIRKRKRHHPAQEKLSAWATGFIGAILAYLVSATFLSAVFYPQIYTIYILAISMLWIQRDIDWEYTLQQRRQMAMAGVSTNGQVGQW